MNKQWNPWWVTVFLISAGWGGVMAADPKTTDPDEDEPVVIQEMATPGYPLAIELGRDESLAFVWIAPMKLWVGKYEVTNGEYRRYDASHDSTNVVGRDLDGDSQPVVHVSWEDAHNYAGWLNRHYDAWLPSNTVFRLPTEREWETFARCGTQRVYPWGNQWPPPNTYNYRGDEGSGFLYSLFQREKFIRGHNDGIIVSTSVTNSGVNAWGLYGVGGNVWEWCADWTDEKKETRVIRGGAWNNERESTLRISHRAAAAPKEDNECIGFRVVIGPPLP